MKKITLLILLLFSVFELNAQIWTINSCSNLGSTTYGPMYSTGSVNANNRTAVIYPSSQLVTLAGQTLNSMYFNRTTATGSITGTPNFKIYLKEVTETDFGASALDWTTGITGATLVYDSNPSTSVGLNAGWKEFEFTSNFLYSGTQNLAVFCEYANPTASSSISWSYEYTAPCSDLLNSNTTKYNNNTTGTLATSLATSNFRRPLIGFDFVVSCAAPTALSVNSITTNSAAISWSQGGTETAWEYSIQPAATGIPTSPIATTAMTVNPTTLMPNTNYEIYVRSNCGGADGNSYWVGPVKFKTLCDEVTAFVENFDAWPTGSTAGLPDCWSKLGTGSAYLATASASPMSAPNRLYMNITATTEVYTLMPSVSNLQANTHRLRFKVYCTTANKTLRVGYFTDATDSSTFVELQSFNMPSTNLASTLEFEVVPTTVPVGVKQLVFSVTPGVSTTAYIDDVKWEINSSCIEPNTLTASLITNNSATLGWTLGGTETLWDIQYGESNFTLGSGIFINDVTSNPYLLSGLVANTTYQYYVRTKCTGSNSSWSGPYSFKTQCDYVTEFVENFDSYTTGTTSLPNCWASGGTSNSTYITTGGAAPMSPANRLYMFASGTTPTEGYAILPGVSNLAANTHRLKFKAYSTAAGRTLEIGYLTDPANVSTFTQIQEITLPGTALVNTEEFTIIPGALPAGVYHLCIKNPAFPSLSTTAYIDDVKWEAIPSCLEPNTLTSSLITNNTAQINWTEGNTSTAWEIEYGVAGFVQGSANGTIVPAPTNPFTLSGLMANTNYEVYVRAVCSTSDSSPWSGPTVFKTFCDDVTEFYESFDTYATGSTNPLADCWNKGGNAFVYLTASSVAPMSPANRLYMSSSGTTTNPTVGYAILPSVSNLQANTHRLKFFAYATNVDRTIEVGYLTDASDVSTFVQLQELNLPSTVAANATEFIIIPGALPAGVKNLCIKNPGFPSSTTIAYLDDFKWEAIPTCTEPNTVLQSFITNNSVSVSWTEGNTNPPTGWEIEYGVTGFTQGSVAGTIVAAPTNPFTLNGLLANTSYDVYVRAVCNTTDSSPWSNVSSFKTQCNDVTEFFEDFESWPSGTTSLPDCWSKAGSSISTYITTGATAPMSPTKRLYMFASGITPTVGYAILPPVSNLQANTHRLRFKGYATILNRTIEVGYFTNISDVSTFVLIQEITLPGSATTTQEFIVDPPALPAGIKNLVIKNPGFTASSTTVYMDDFYWEASPTTAPLCVTNLIATPNASCGNFATTISWDAAANANGYKLTVGTTTGSNDILDNVDLGNVTTYNFVGTTNTTYFYKLVPYNTVAGASGCVEQSFTTFVTGCACTPIYTTGITSNDLISNVVITGTTLANNSGTVNVGPSYTYFNGQPNYTADLQKGVTYDLVVTVGTYGSQNVAVWIDFNDDLNFDASEKVGFTSTSIAANSSGTISIPITCSAQIGSHIMRIRDVYSTSASFGSTIDPCNSYAYGETEDYLITIVATPAPTGDAIQNISVVDPTEATIEDLIVAPSSVIWYLTEADALANTNPLAAGTQLVNSTTYYAVNLANGCYSQPFEVVVSVVLGNNEFDNNTFTYYPNPVNDILNITHTSEISSISIVNLIGQSILFEEINSNNYQLDMSNLNAGVYLVKVKANNTEKTIKITKQ